MVDSTKIYFLQHQLAELCGRIDASHVGKWGKMNAQQMLEHLSDFFNVSTEKISFPLVTSEEDLPKYRAFLYSDKAFRENTKAPETVLGAEPLPMRSKDIASAKAYLSSTVNDFFSHFNSDPTRKTLHPVFGMLTFEEWVLLHYKHVQHHLKQFSLID